MRNHFHGTMNMKKLFAVLMLNAAVVKADAITVVLDPQALPSSGTISVDGNNNCNPPKPTSWAKDFVPVLPEGAVVLTNRISGSVDDEAHITGNGSGEAVVGACNGPYAFSQDITSVAPDGSCHIELHDRTDVATQDNVVAFSGYATITCLLTNTPTPDTGPTNLDGEICGWETNCEGEVQQIKCTYDKPDCSGCRKKGSPQTSFGVANFNVKVEDTPIWQETAVGAALEIDMRFANTGENNTNSTFGPKWSCNWNSSVSVVNPGTNRMLFPSGSIALFTLSTNATFLPSDALEGYLVLTNGVYQYRKPDGWTWEYSPSQGSTNVYLVSTVRDAWSNTVSVTYTNDRLYRATQTSPNSGRYLEFSYSGTNSRAISVSTETGASRTATFAYSSAGLLTNVVDVGGFSYSYEYTNGYLARVLKGATERLAVSYSATPEKWTATNSYWVQLNDAGGFSRKYTWEFGAVKQETTRNGSSVVNYYGVSTAGTRGRVLTTVASFSGAQEQYQYTTQGRISNRTDRTGGHWTQGYNAQHRLISATDPLGNTLTSVYDSNGVDLLFEIPPTGPVQKVFSYVSGKHAVASVSNVLGEVVSYSYNALGLVTNIYNGRTTEMRSYDAEGRLTAILRNGELIETNRFDAFGRLSWRRDAAGMIVSNAYDGLSRVVSQTFDNNGQISVLSNHYDCCFMDQVVDRRGNSWGYSFNEIGEKQWESNPKGLSTYYTYNVYGQPSAISNALEWTLRWYNQAGWLQSIEYPERPFDAKHWANFWYDDAGRIVKKGTISGALYKYTYDAAGRQVAAYVPDGNTYPWFVEMYVLGETNLYDSLGRVIWTKDVRGLAVSNEYNALGQITTKTYPDGSTENWTYNAWGDVTTMRDRAGNITSNVYDNLGRVTQQVDARGVSTFYAYTNADLVSAVSNAALAFVWRYQYDAEGRVTSATYPDGSQENRSYDPLGNITQMVKGGVTTTFSYDELGNRTAVVVDGATVESSTYDGLGRLLSTQNADGLVTSNGWDNWGQLDTRLWPSGLQESFQYGDRGLTNAMDRLGIPVRIVPDSMGQIVQQIDGATNAVSYVYLSNGVNQVASLWDGNSNKTAWAYDIFGNPTTKTYADSSQESYQFDKLNRLTNKVDTASFSTGYGYDQNGNLLSVKYGALSPVTFGYDALNRRTNMADAVGSTVWTYDSLGRITSEQGPFGTNAVSVSYDARGRMTNLVFGSYSANYSYDSKGRITGVQAPEGHYSFSYLAQGIKKAQVTYPNGVTENLTYDTLTRLTNMVYASGTNTLLSIRYGFDNGDSRASETWNTGRNATYGYDRAYQLLSSTSTARPSDNVSYTYDKAGNPLHRTEMGLTSDYGFNSLNQFTSGSWTGKLTVAGELNYAAGTVTVNGAVGQVFPDRTFEASNITVSAGSNQLTAVYTGPAFTNTAMTATSKVSVTVGNPAFGYDAKGNLTNDAEFIYFYDLANRLTNAVSKATGASVLAAQYDGLGRRVEVTRNGMNVERYVYFPGSFLMLAVLDGSNQIKEVWSRGPDLSGVIGGAGGIGGILSVSTNIGTASVSMYFHADAMGNVVLVSSSAGQQVAQYRFSPFGKLVSQIGNYQARFAFSSKELDPEIGLLCFGARYFNPKTGTWTARDPLQNRTQRHLYAFNRNNPLRYVDPDGRAPQLVGIGPCGEPIYGPDVDWGDYDPLWGGRGAGAHSSADLSGWPGAFQDFGTWVGGAEQTANYGPDNPETQQMRSSEIAAKLRNSFTAINRGYPCDKWKDQPSIGLTFGLKEFIVNLPNGTAHFVGSADGDVKITARSDCDLTARLHIVNRTSLRSFLYHLWPESWNIETPGRPFANWYQNYEWEETFDCGGRSSHR